MENPLKRKQKNSIDVDGKYCKDHIELEKSLARIEGENLVIIGLIITMIFFIIERVI